MAADITNINLASGCILDHKHQTGLWWEARTTYHNRTSVLIMNFNMVSNGHRDHRHQQALQSQQRLWTSTLLFIPTLISEIHLISGTNWDY